MISAPVVITPPVGDLFDVASLKLFLRIDGDDLDDEVALYAKAVVADIERMTSTKIGRQVVELRADCFADLDHLPIGPVTDIVELRYRAGNGEIVTVDPADYELIVSGLEASVRPSLGMSWPRLGLTGIALQLSVGYGDDVPPSVTLAIHEAVRARYDGTGYDLASALVNDRIWA